MSHLVDKYPYKKLLFLNWYEAAIGHLLLFKYLKEKFLNNIYFLISQQGIMLKSTTQDLLHNVQEQLSKFFSAKIQQLQVSASSDFYQHIIQDIKQQTQKLKDNKDCPYINLVYSQKLKHSCLAMKKYGFIKPYQQWQCRERQRKGFCFLIVRPQHRWKDIANNVLALIKKRQGYHQKQIAQNFWPIDICYQKFIWFFLKKQFKKYQKNIQIKQKKFENTLTITIKKDISQFTQLQKQIQSLNFIYYSYKPSIEQKLQQKLIILSSHQLQKITQLIYHQFGLTGFVRDLRRKISNYLIIGSIDDLSQIDNQIIIKSQIQIKQDMKKINQNLITTIIKLGKRHSLVNYQGINFVMVKFQKPLPSNIQRTLKIRIPCLPKYYYWFEKQDNIYLLRNYYPIKFLQLFMKNNLYQQIMLLFCFFSILKQLHYRQIYIGKKMIHSVYVDQRRVIFQTGDIGNKNQDINKCSSIVIQWLEFLKNLQIKQKLKKYLQSNFDMTQICSYLQQQLDKIQ